MPNFLADLGRGGPAITGALRDVTQTALTLEQMKSMNQERAIRENTLRMQQVTFEKEQKEEERKNRVIPFNIAASALRPEAKEGTELYKEMYNFAKGLGVIENVGNEEVISGRNIETAIAQFKGNEERFWDASLKDINNTITQLQAPTEKPLKPEEQQARQQQIETLLARKTGVINKLKGEAQLKLEREQTLKEQEITAQKEKATEKFKTDIALEIVKGEEAIKLEREKAKSTIKEKITDKKEKDIKHIEDTIDKYDEDIAAYSIKDNPLALDAIKPIELKRKQTIKKWESLTGKKYPVVPEIENTEETKDWTSWLSDIGTQAIQNIKNFYSPK